MTHTAPLVPSDPATPLGSPFSVRPGQRSRTSTTRRPRASTAPTAASPSAKGKWGAAAAGCLWPRAGEGRVGAGSNRGGPGPGCAGSGRGSEAAAGWGDRTGALGAGRCCLSRLLPEQPLGHRAAVRLRCPSPSRQHTGRSRLFSPSVALPRGRCRHRRRVLMLRRAGRWRRLPGGAERC